MESFNSRSSTSKSYRMIKIKRRVKNEGKLAEDDEKDYMLEKEGDITSYLNSNLQKPLLPRYNKDGEIVAHSIIGPVSLFSSETKEISSTIRKLPTLHKKRQKDTEINPRARFQNILDQISDMQKTVVKQEKTKFNSISKRQKHMESRQDSVIQNFQKTLKYWSKIQNNLVVKSRKTPKDLTYSHSNASNTPNKLRRSRDIQENSKLIWYMKLRDSSEDNKFEAFLRVGNNLSGIYSRIQVRKPSKASQGYEVIEDLDLKDNPDLEIVGVSKLPMEIQAVEKIGCEYLKPELLDLTKHEEVIEENYHPKVKAGLI